jgi:hypothetical protein
MLTATCACARFPLAKTKPIPTASRLRLFNTRVTPPTVRRANSIPVSWVLPNLLTERQSSVEWGGIWWPGGGRTHTKSELRQILGRGVFSKLAFGTRVAPDFSLQALPGGGLGSSLNEGGPTSWSGRGQPFMGRSIPQHERDSSERTPQSLQFSYEPRRSPGRSLRLTKPASADCRKGAGRQNSSRVPGE